MSDSNRTDHSSSVVFHSHSEAETIAFARGLASRLQPGDVVALIGDLGAGKTRFIRGLVKGVGLNASRVTSPTFVLLQEYADETAQVTLAHIDAYRLTHADELETIGWDELLADPNLIIAIEWAERIEPHLPDDYLRIEITHHEGASRTITMTPMGAHMRKRDWSVESANKGTSTCPTCGNAVESNSSLFPFCSERCRLVDLGKWFGGKYVVSREIDPDDDISEFE